VQPHTYALLLDKYKQLLQHLEFEVGEGQKYNMHTAAKGAAFDLYHHELVGGEQAKSTLLSKQNEKSVAAFFYNANAFCAG
jgi:hypothetical protein